jgi:hypothetical protein
MMFENPSTTFTLEKYLFTLSPLMLSRHYLIMISRLVRTGNMVPPKWKIWAHGEEVEKWEYFGVEKKSVLDWKGVYHVQSQMQQIYYQVGT